MKSYLLCLAGNPELQDRIEIFSEAGRLIVALADGAGGISGGAQAAESFIQIVAQQKTFLRNSEDCIRLLKLADQSISGSPTAGETTGIILIVEAKEIYGASVGDSEAWIFMSSGARHLTQNQRRKPFLGSGAATAVGFTLAAPHGLIIVATDGLWKYTSHEKIAAEVQLGNASTLPERIANLVRLRSGALQDDLAIAVISFD